MPNNTKMLTKAEVLPTSGCQLGGGHTSKM